MQLRVLILGEYESAGVQRQLELVDSLSDETPPTVFMIRPHPASPFTATPESRVVECDPNTSLADVLAWCDAVVVGETSSVVIEALGSRKPVAIVEDAALLPTNPLGHSPECALLRSPTDLARWIRRLHSDTSSMAPTTTPDDFYFLDPGLGRWKALLGALGNMLHPSP